YLSDYVPDPASAIVFPQEFGCHQILPAASYQLTYDERSHGIPQMANCTTFRSSESCHADIYPKRLVVTAGLVTPKHTTWRIRRHRIGLGDCRGGRFDPSVRLSPPTATATGP
ncbi:hypothetical protein LXA43DRAFT_900822, partial [Ganoderma leucocontextum]